MTLAAATSRLVSSLDPRRAHEVCEQLLASAGVTVGGFAAYAAEHHGVHVTGFTVSEEQVRWAHQHHGHLAIDIRRGDYRQAAGTFDAVVSIGLMEHVGPRNYRAYMELVDRCLAPGGVALIHTIGGNRARTQLEARYDARFYRVWSYYLLASASAFRARGQQLFQIVMTRPGTPPPPGRRGLPRSRA